MANKSTPCLIPREQFRKGAKDIKVIIGDRSDVATVKEFSTGSLGWYLNGKMQVEIDGVRVQVQIG